MYGASDKKYTKEELLSMSISRLKRIVKDLNVPDDTRKSYKPMRPKPRMPPKPKPKPNPNPRPNPRPNPGYETLPKPSSICSEAGARRAIDARSAAGAKKAAGARRAADARSAAGARREAGARKAIGARSAQGYSSNNDSLVEFILKYQ